MTQPKKRQGLKINLNLGSVIKAAMGDYSALTKDILGDTKIGPLNNDSTSKALSALGGELTASETNDVLSGTLAGDTPQVDVPTTEDSFLGGFGKTVSEALDTVDSVRKIPSQALDGLFTEIAGDKPSKLLNDLLKDIIPQDLMGTKKGDNTLSEIFGLLRRASQ